MTWRPLHVKNLHQALAAVTVPAYRVLARGDYRILIFVNRDALSCTVSNLPRRLIIAHLLHRSIICDIYEFDNCSILQ